MVEAKDRPIKDEKKETSVIPKSTVLATEYQFNKKDRSAIRKALNSFLLKKEPATIDDLLSLISECETPPKFSIHALKPVLLELIFKYTKQQANRDLKKEESTARRRRYLEQIAQFREDGRPIYYLDEMWTWVSSATTKRERLIILHVGSENGFVQGGLLLFESENDRKEMNAARFEEWFAKLLPKLKPNAVIVMDNAPYHSRLLNRVPNDKSKKSEIHEWLQAKGVTFDKAAKKPELLVLVKENKPEPQYAVDTMASAKKRTVLRLPPYHCELNPIELIWERIKKEVAKMKKTSSQSKSIELYAAAIANINSDYWKKCIFCVGKIENVITQLDDYKDSSSSKAY